MGRDRRGWCCKVTYPANTEGQNYGLQTSSVACRSFIGHVVTGNEGVHQTVCSESKSFLQTQRQAARDFPLATARLSLGIGRERAEKTRLTLE